MEREAVIVTGASGYIGRHVVRALLDRGHAVRAVVREQTVDIDPRAVQVIADILDPTLDVSALLGPRPAAVVHLAWQDGFRHDSPAHMANLSAHVKFINELGSSVPRVSVLGTMHEVGYWEGPIDSETPTNPRSQYGIAKDALRRSLELSLPSITEFAWLRCYYIFGDDRRSNSIFARLLEAADAGRDVFPFTSGVNKYDFIHVTVLADQIAVAATAPGVTGIINCSSGIPVSLAEQVEAFILTHRLNIRLDYGAFPDRPYDSPVVWGDASRIQQLMMDAG